MFIVHTFNAEEAVGVAAFQTDGMEGLFQAGRAGFWARSWF